MIPKTIEEKLLWEIEQIRKDLDMLTYLGELSRIRDALIGIGEGLTDLTRSIDTLIGTIEEREGDISDMVEVIRNDVGWIRHDAKRIADSLERRR